jgi:hypothetical protein
LVSAAQRGDYALAHVATLPAGLDDLEILARVRPGATTFDAHEHAVIIDSAPLHRKKKMRGPSPRGTTFCPFARVKRRNSASCRKRRGYCCRK